MKDPYRLSLKEEIGNSISHGVMWLIILILLPTFAVRSYILGSFKYAIGISVYLICMFFMYMGSMLYHISPYQTTHKYIFRKLDHIMILLAIAGTYTPICLCVLPIRVGLPVLILEWGLAVAGIVLKAVSVYSYPKLSMAIYMLMGWLAVFTFPILLEHCSFWFLFLIVLGGLFYTIGAFFYAHPEKSFFHFIWHCFIILASVCHFIAIAFFIY
ncbi:MAG: hemolysin III family protein [Erysipelotrichaceae bacterium]|nr:hemolysin III family protein [Erysipelotrichaceae bacterium]